MHLNTYLLGTLSTHLRVDYKVDIVENLSPLKNQSRNSMESLLSESILFFPLSPIFHARTYMLLRSTSYTTRTSIWIHPKYSIWKHSHTPSFSPTRITIHKCFLTLLHRPIQVISVGCPTTSDEVAEVAVMSSTQNCVRSILVLPSNAPVVRGHVFYLIRKETEIYSAPKC